MQVALGAVYAWSVFRIPLTKTYGWTIPEVTLAFEIAILVLGFAAAVGGVWMRRAGPRPVAFTAALLYGCGVALAGPSAGHLALLYLTYGILAGIGLGLGYIVPVATLIQWFPDRRGMITGVAVAGFGAGALITAPLAQALIQAVGVAATFEILGIAYLAIIAGAAFFMKEPPRGYVQPGFNPSNSKFKEQNSQSFVLRQALGTWQWYALWLTLFLNTTAGIALISQASPMAQEISHVTAARAAGLVGIVSIANGMGRLLWAWLSDLLGRRIVFAIMFLLQALAFALLSQAESFGALTILAFLVLLCYGGGFGTMPAFAADFFGPKNIGSVYGFMLTAWGAAGVCGPTLIATVREASGHYEGAFRIMAGVMLLGAVAPLLLHPPRLRQARPKEPL